MGLLRLERLSPDTLLIRYGGGRASAVSTVFTGVGVGECDGVVVRRVGRDFRTPPEGLRGLATRIAAEAGLEPGKAVVVFTAADIGDAVTAEARYEGGEAAVAVVAGFDPPACVEQGTLHSVREVRGAGTITVVAATSRRLSLPAALDMLRVVSEAKAAACSDLLLRCGSRAVGTVTDNVTVLYPAGGGGPALPWAGMATLDGNAVASLTYGAVVEAGLKALDPEDRLREAIGLGVDELVEAALKAYRNAPVPGLEEGFVRKRVSEHIKSFLKDPNTWAFIIAARELDLHGRAGTIPGLSRGEFEADTVKIVSDELLSMALATYLAGAKALFATYWVERIKKGGGLPEVNSLPMFEDDVASALIASALTKLYDEVLGG